MKKYAIIVAGGSGSRMQSIIPKQFLLLNGLPIIIHSIRAFIKADTNIQLILVIPELEMNRWNLIADGFKVPTNITVVLGGKTRFESVQNGLSQITTSGLVAVHDAVRPLINAEKINQLFIEAEKKSNAIPALPCIDTVRMETTIGDYELLDRSKLWMMQTPQCFTTSVLINAYKNAATNEYTDDAAVAQASGTKLNLVLGDKNNFKITVPEDLKLAEFILKEVSC
jgi:2-C-methyl-D-erythritol 4-phosphate cytidylyltransferase